LTLNEAMVFFVSEFRFWQVSPRMKLFNLINLWLGYQQVTQEKEMLSQLAFS